MDENGTVVEADGRTDAPGGGYVPIGRAAALLGVHRDALRRSAEAGDVPGRRVPGGKRGPVWEVWLTDAGALPEDVRRAPRVTRAPARAAQVAQTDATTAIAIVPALVTALQDALHAARADAHDARAELRDLARALGKAEAERDALAARLADAEQRRVESEQGRMQAMDAMQEMIEQRVARVDTLLDRRDGRPWWRFW